MNNRLNFEFEEKSQPISYVETMQVKDEVECDVYTFDDDSEKDLAIIRIEQGSHTPLQEVLKGDKTIEGYTSGKGVLVITQKDGEVKTYEVDESTPKPFEVTVSVGEKMQWKANEDSTLEVYEVCFPPYVDGRFKNLPE